MILLKLHINVSLSLRGPLSGASSHRHAPRISHCCTTIIITITITITTYLLLAFFLPQSRSPARHMVSAIFGAVAIREVQKPAAQTARSLVVPASIYEQQRASTALLRAICRGSLRAILAPCILVGLQLTSALLATHAHSSLDVSGHRPFECVRPTHAEYSVDGKEK
jgi:hypothetical protein